MNISYRFKLASYLLDTFIIQQNAAFVKQNLVIIQNFRFVDYELDNGKIVIQLYHVPKTSYSEYELKRSSDHLDNRTILLTKQGKTVINISLEEVIGNFEEVKDFLALELNKS